MIKNKTAPPFGGASGLLAERNVIILYTHSFRSQVVVIHSLIDDVRIYNRALSAEEIQQLYNLGRQRIKIIINRIFKLNLCPKIFNKPWI